jgi:hypothetical protein
MNQRSRVLFYCRVKYNFDVTEVLLNYLLDSGLYFFHATKAGHPPTAFRSRGKRA